MALSLKKLTFLWRIFGLFPYTIQDNTILSSTKSWFFTFPEIVIMLSTLCLVIKLDHARNIHIYYGIHDAAVITSLFYRFIFQRHINKGIISALKIIVQTDLSLKRAGYVSNKNVTTVRNYIICGIYLLTTLPPLFISSKNLIHFLCQYVNFLWSFCLVLNSDILFLIHDYFVILRETLEASRNSKKQLHSAYKLDVLVHCYDNLCRASSTLNEVLSPIFLLFVSLTFYSVLVGFYSLALLMLNESPGLIGNRSISLLFAAAVQIIVNILPIGEIVEEAREFNTLLYQIIIEDKTNKLVSNKKLRLHIQMKREVLFTACGVFNIDFSLLHSMLAAVATYLVILIQFNNYNQSTSLAPTSAEEFSSFSTTNSTTSLYDKVAALPD